MQMIADHENSIRAHQGRVGEAVAGQLPRAFCAHIKFDASTTAGCCSMPTARSCASRYRVQRSCLPRRAQEHSFPGCEYVGRFWYDGHHVSTDSRGVFVTAANRLRQRYGHSKQAAIRWSKELNDRYRFKGKLKYFCLHSYTTLTPGLLGITAYSLHPGLIRSNLQNGDPSMVGRIMRVGMSIAVKTTPLEGSYNSLFCATSPTAPAAGEGCYFTPVGKREDSRQALEWLGDRETNTRLWQLGENAMARLR
jgi:hypothetical protein